MEKITIYKVDNFQNQKTFWFMYGEKSETTKEWKVVEISSQEIDEIRECTYSRLQEILQKKYENLTVIFEE